MPSRRPCCLPSPEQAREEAWASGWVRSRAGFRSSPRTSAPTWGAESAAPSRCTPTAGQPPGRRRPVRPSPETACSPPWPKTTQIGQFRARPSAQPVDRSPARADQPLLGPTLPAGSHVSAGVRPAGPQNRDSHGGDATCQNAGDPRLAEVLHPVARARLQDAADTAILRRDGRPSTGSDRVEPNGRPIDPTRGPAIARSSPQQPGGSRRHPVGGPPCATLGGDALLARGRASRRP